MYGLSKSGQHYESNDTINYFGRVFTRWQTELFEQGRITEFQDQFSTTSYSYDSLGMMSRKIYDECYAHEYDVTYQWNNKKRHLLQCLHHFDEIDSIDYYFDCSLRLIKKIAKHKPLIKYGIDTTLYYYQGMQPIRVVNKSTGPTMNQPFLYSSEMDFYYQNERPFVTKLKYYHVDHVTLDTITSGDIVCFYGSDGIIDSTQSDGKIIAIFRCIK